VTKIRIGDFADSGKLTNKLDLSQGTTGEVKLKKGRSPAWIGKGIGKRHDYEGRIE
jgi:hypothetical protein